MSSIEGIRGDDLAGGPATAGMLRKQAPIAEDVTVVDVHTDPETFSGWHHHGDYTTCGYVLAGKLRFEWGPGGAENVEFATGDFFLVPPHTIHREGNPGSEMQHLVGFRFGTGPSVVNVDGPEE